MNLDDTRWDLREARLTGRVQIINQLFDFIYDLTTSFVVWTKLNLFVFMFIRPLFLSNEKVLSISKSLSLYDVKEVEERLNFPISWGSEYSAYSLTNTLGREFSVLYDFIFNRIGIKFRFYLYLRKNNLIQFIFKKK